MKHDYQQQEAELNAFLAHDLEEASELYRDTKCKIELHKRVPWAALYYVTGILPGLESTLEDIKNRILDDDFDVLKTITPEAYLSRLEDDFELNKEKYLKEFVNQNYRINS